MGGGALISSRIIMVQVLSIRSLFKSNFPGPFARGVEGIRRFLVSYRQDQENNETFASLYDGRSNKSRVSHFKDLH